MEAALIISAILQIVILICFFILCSNVSKIKKQIVQDTDFESKFKFLMKIGEKDKAREILIDRILANGVFSSGLTWNADQKGQKCFEIYGEELSSLGIQNPFSKEENKE